MYKSYLGAALLSIATCLTPPTIAVSKETTTVEGHLRGSSLWADYKARFLSDDGRIIDNANNRISHSEGQGYGMLLALAASDQTSFEAIYAFAKDTLQVRKDRLFSWKYIPDGANKVPDRNNATDGDILIAWALMEAAEAGWGETYRADANAILHDVKKLFVETDSVGLIIVPGSKGFVDEKKNLTINPSYWVFPALERLGELTGDLQWVRLAASGQYLIEQLKAVSVKGLPDWAVLNNQEVNATMHSEKSSLFGYEAIRVPLYLMMASGSKKQLAFDVLNEVQKPGKQEILRVDAKKGSIKGSFKTQGYLSIASLANCLRDGSKFPDDHTNTLDTQYYPATLQLLAIMAAAREAKECL
jgi:endoglucanase